MTRTEEGRADLAGLLQGLGVFLVFLHLVLRLMVSSTITETALDLFFHSLVWIGAALWLLGRALAGFFVFRYTGGEILLLLWIIFCLLSIHRAEHKLSAIRHAYVFATFPILYAWIASALGPERRHWLLSFLLSFAFVTSAYALLQSEWINPRLRETTGVADLLTSSDATERDLASRFLANEPFATFNYPNTFAGVLILLTPMITGFGIDALRRKSGPGPIAFSAITLMLSVVALIRTGSLGGGVAAGFAALVFGGLLLARRSERWKSAVKQTAASAAVVAILLVAFGPLRPDRVGARIPSIAVRNVYWESALKIAADHPLTGVGLDNFEAHFPAYKSDAPQETRKAHNDYLQILCELGIPGLLVFLLLLFWILRAAFRTGDEPPPCDPSRPPRLLFLAAVATGLTFAYVTVDAFNDIDGSPLLAFVVLALWAGPLLWISRTNADLLSGPSEFLRLGAAAGLAGFALHMMVDFDFYDFGAATMFFLVAAIVVPLRRKPVEIRLGAKSAGAAAGVLLLVSLPVQILLVPSLLQAEGAHDRAEELSAKGKGRDALEEVMRGLDASPLDGRLHVLKANLFRREWEESLRRKGASEASSAEMMMLETRVLEGLSDARRLFPRSPALHHLQGEFSLRLWRYYRDLSRSATSPSTPYHAQSLGHLSQAEASFRKAVDLYPTNALYVYWTARVNDLRGSEGDALPHYRRALELSGKAEQGRSPRLMLRPDDRAHARLRCGDETGAVDEMARHLRALLQEALDRAARPTPPDEILKLLDRMRAEPSEYVSAWYDPRMEPVLKAACERVAAEVRRIGSGGRP